MHAASLWARVTLELDGPIQPTALASADLVVAKAVALHLTAWVGREKPLGQAEHTSQHSLGQHDKWAPTLCGVHWQAPNCVCLSLPLACSGLLWLALSLLRLGSGDNLNYVCVCVSVSMAPREQERERRRR